MSKINEILNRKTPLHKTKPDFKRVDGNFKDASGSAVELYKAQLQGQGVSGDYSGGGTFKNKAEKDWYDNQIKTRMDSGMSNEEAITDYRNTFKIGTKGPDKPGKITDVYKTKPITQTNQNVETNTVDKPMETNYNMSYKNSVNANWAEGAQRRGTRRAERRAQRDLDIYSGEKNSGFLGLGGKKNQGKLSANVLAAAEKTGLKSEKLREMGLNVDDKGVITGDDDQNVTGQMRDRAKNLSRNKYNQALNKEKIIQLPSSETTTTTGPEITSNVIAGADAVDVSGYNMYNPGENDLGGAFTGFKSNLNADDLKINVPDLNTSISNALKNTSIGVSPSDNAKNAVAETNTEIDNEQNFIDNKGFGGSFLMKRGKMNRPGYSN